MRGRREETVLADRGGNARTSQHCWQPSRRDVVRGQARAAERRRVLLYVCVYCCMCMCAITIITIICRCLHGAVAARWWRPRRRPPTQRLGGGAGPCFVSARPGEACSPLHPPQKCRRGLLPGPRHARRKLGGRHTAPADDLRQIAGSLKTTLVSYASIITAKHLSRRPGRR